MEFVEGSTKGLVAPGFFAQIPGYPIILRTPHMADVSAFRPGLTKS